MILNLVTRTSLFSNMNDKEMFHFVYSHNIQVVMSLRMPMDRAPYNKSTNDGRGFSFSVATYNHKRVSMSCFQSNDALKQVTRQQ